MYDDKLTVLGNPAGGGGDHPIHCHAPNVKTVPSRRISSVVFSTRTTGSSIYYHRHVCLPRTPHRAEPWSGLPRLRPDGALLCHHVDVSVQLHVLPRPERSSAPENDRDDL